MLRTVLAVISMGTAVAIFSCSGGSISNGGTGGTSTGGTSSGGTGGPGGCVGTIHPAQCFRPCDGTYATPDGGACLNSSYQYHAAFCLAPGEFVDGQGPVPNTCGDGGADVRADSGPADASADACQGTLIPAWCFDNGAGCWAFPDGGSCATGATYYAETCFFGAVDGRGPICSAGGTGGRGN